MKRTNKQFAILLRIIVICAICIATAFSAVAQNASTTAVQTMNLALSDAIELSFVNGGGTINTTFSTASELISGKETATQDLRVRSNKKFKVAVNTTSSNFSYSGSANSNNVIPVSTGFKVMVTANHTGGYMTLSALLGWVGLTCGSSTSLLTACNAGDNQTFSVKYKTTPGILAAPGTYTADVVFTATQL